MATPSEIKSQVQLEKEAISCGRTRLHESLQKLESQSYASASVYGTASIITALPGVIKEIDSTRSKLKKGNAGQYYLPISIYLDRVESLAIATIALKITFDNVFSMKRDADLLTNVIVHIGSALENECKFRWYRENYPHLFKYIEDKYFHESCGTQQKVAIANVIFNRKDIVWPKWGIKSRTMIGSWALNATITATDWFEKSAQTARKRSKCRLIPTTTFTAVRDQLIATAELFSGIPYPMLIEPNDWTNERAGGYLCNELMRGYPLTRHGNPTVLHGDIPLSFLNKLQKVRYRVSKHVLYTARCLRDRGRVVGKFIPIHESFKPPKPSDIADNNEAKQKYRRETAEAYNADRLNFKRSVRTRTQLEAAEKFKDEVFYLCWSFDYRGRAYPIPAFLTPQDTDFGKSLIRFADESKVTDDARLWLAFQVATTFGKDKESIKDR